MILERIANALRRQDWAVVLLELVIVIVGIFLGLQVDDWNEARKEREREAVYLEKIEEEVAAMREELVRRIDQRTERIARMVSALRALERCDQSEKAIADMRYALASYQNGPGIDYRSATYDEMVETGSLARIQDGPLKYAISEAFTRIQRFNSGIVTFRASLPVVDAIVWKRFAFSVEEDGERLSVPTIEPARLCDDPELRSAFAEMIDIQNDGRFAAERALEAVDDLLLRLGD